MQDDLQSQQSQGSYDPEGSRDILEKALESKEHPGRLRGKSRFYKQSDYFGDDMKEPKHVAIKKLQEEVRQLQEKMKQKTTSPSTTTEAHNSARGSCTEETKFVAHSQSSPVEGQSCFLCIDDGDDTRAVAQGRVWS